MNHASDYPDLSAPSARLMLSEARAPFEFVRFLMRASRQKDLPPGDGHAVMLIPGFGVSDVALKPLARAIDRLGYATYGWGEGVNLGMRREIRHNLVIRLRALNERHASAVSLIGWSLGGVFAREMARANPQLVRRVISLGSPINGHPAANNMMPLFRLANRGKPVNEDLEGFNRRKIAPPVPCTAIYSRTDGVVAWQACLEEPAENTENLQVSASHFALPFNLDALACIAQRLAIPEPQADQSGSSAKQPVSKTGPADQK